MVLDIRPYIVESQNLDSFHFGYSTAGLAHNEDYVILKGPITVDYYFHHCGAAPCTIPVIVEPSVRVIIPAWVELKSTDISPAISRHFSLKGGVFPFSRQI